MRSTKESWTVGILLFDDVEVLDFTGPFEVFSITSLGDGDEVYPFTVRTVSQKKTTVYARNGLKILPDYDFTSSPHFDILVVPGGPGARNREYHNQDLLDWIRNESEHSLITASVCTGALLLAKAGLLSGKSATTHWRSYDFLEKQYPDVSLVRDVKYIDEGNILTSGGISSGINLSLHIVEKLLGAESAVKTARRLEFQMDSGGNS